MSKSFFAHLEKQADGEGRAQTVLQHNENVAQLSETLCALPELKSLSWLIGYFHDAGKYADAFQTYLKNAVEDSHSVRRGEVDHATAGGQILAELLRAQQIKPSPLLSEWARYAVFSHHGMYDAMDLEGESLFEKRLKKQRENTPYCGEYESAKTRFLEECDRGQIQAYIGQAMCGTGRFMEQIKSLAEKVSVRAGKSDKDLQAEQRRQKSFYEGLTARLLLSVLVDADRLDSAAFGQNTAVRADFPAGERRQLWEKCSAHFETYLSALQGANRGKLGDVRARISDRCRSAAEGGTRLYRLSVPTGAGKTLSAMRFALHNAIKHGRQRIFYVAPFHSILEQNAEVLRNAVGMPEVVLEHHSNTVQETQAERERYDRLTETWDAPIVLTTAVQLLNTLFSRDTASVRRMHNLCNSIIVFDEVQALPVKTVGLFSSAVNFLCALCNAAVVLCSATQPVLDELGRCRLLPPEDMVCLTKEEEDVFRRTRLVNEVRTERGTVEKTVDALSEECAQVARECGSVLAVVNTRKCAYALFTALRQKMRDEPCRLYHLSTNMCAAHRISVLNAVRQDLRGDVPVVCVSTQLIEAGVDISFRAVFRSLAGLDSLTQAAGRCNREGRDQEGRVYLVKLNGEEENVSSLKDIFTAQNAMQSIFQRCEENGYSLSDRRAIVQYYREYLFSRQKETLYPVQVNGCNVDLADLLSLNIWSKTQRAWKCREAGLPYRCGQPLAQAFQTAGENFRVIDDGDRLPVIVEYDAESMRLLSLLQTQSSSNEVKDTLRKLQRYGVEISEDTRRELGDALHTECEGLVTVLSQNYYDDDTGVSLSYVSRPMIN